MEKKELLKLLSDKAREVGSLAQWYSVQDCTSLSECCRVAQRTILDLIDMVRKDCDSVESVLETIDQMQYCFWNEYKGYQADSFERFAELSMSSYRVLGCVACAIER